MAQSLKKFLPSKKFLLILGGIIIVVVLFFILRDTSNVKKNSKGTLNVGPLTVSEIIDGDRDGDGIRDWEEALWGTNADMMDTDADGISDKDEIEARRAEINKNNIAAGTDATEPLNETDEFARDLFASIVSLSEKGALDDKSIQDLASTVSGSASDKVDLPDFATEVSIKTTASNEANKKTYITKLVGLLQKYDERGVGREIDIYREYLISQDATILSGLGTTSTEYQKFALELRAISPTADLVKIHTDIINGLYNTSIALKNIAEAETNPIIGSIGVGQYKKYYFKLESTLQSLTPLFVDSGIL